MFSVLALGSVCFYEAYCSPLHS